MKKCHWSCKAKVLFARRYYWQMISTFINQKAIFASRLGLFIHTECQRPVGFIMLIGSQRGSERAGFCGLIETYQSEVHAFV